MESRTVDLDGPEPVSVHYADFGGAGRPIVLCHGLGGSHLNWLAVAPRLAAHGRVLALDLAGHGRTLAPRRRSATVAANRRLLERFLHTVVREPAILIGNSMGGYLSLAVAAAEPERVAGLVLVDPAQPLVPGAPIDRVVLRNFAGLALPFIAGALMRRRAKHGPEQAVRDTMKLCCADVNRLDPAITEAHFALARERSSRAGLVRRDFIVAARSLTFALAFRKRFFALVRSIRARGLIVQGALDRLVRVEASRALAAARPDWRLEVIEGVGHIPQLEVPEQFLAVVEPWLSG